MDGPPDEIAATVDRSEIPLRVRLAGLTRSANLAQQKVATFLLETYDVASGYSITEVARLAGVSSGSVSTLCKSLGMRGYSELRFALARDAVAQQMTEPRPEGGDPSASKAISAGQRAIRDAFGADLQALAETESALPAADLEEAARLIRAARQVVLAGIASSAVLAAETAIKLRKLGVRAVFDPDSHSQAMAAALLEDADVLLVFSHSGRTIEVLRAARLARQRGASVIAVVGIGASPLFDLADVVLPVVAHDSAYRVEPTASSVAALAIVHALFLLLFSAHGPAEESYRRSLDAVIDREQR